MRTTLAAFSLALLVGTTPLAANEVSAWRGFVADSQTGAVSVVDLLDGTVLERFELAGPGRLYAGPSGRYAFVVQQAANQVAVLDGGIAFEDHGEHDDIEVTAPALLPVVIEGAEPVHFNTGAGTVAVFFDGDGTAGLWREADLVEGKVEPLTTLSTAGAHHGVAKPLGDLVALSVPTPGERLPDAVALVDHAGSKVVEVPCARLHGEGATNRFTAFGCADGVAVFDAGTQPPTGRFLAYGTDLPGERMVRNLRGAAHHTVLFGDFGVDGMVVIDPSAEAGDMTFVALPAPRMHFAMNPEPGDVAFVLVADGRLLKLSAFTGRLLAEASVTAPYSMERGVVRPRVATAGPLVLVSDPAAGEVIVLEADDLQELRRVPVGGQPFDVLVLGGTGHAH